MAMSALFALAVPERAQADEYWGFETRPGVIVPAIITAPLRPRAVAVLFTGGRGIVGARPDGTMRHKTNFLVANRARFARNGLVAVVVDAPSDRARNGLEDGFRESRDHAEDIRLVILALRRTYDLPIWLVGTSRGSTSVANAGIRLQAAPPDGLVLTSSISQENRRGGNLLDMNLKAIRTPTLVAHHLDDDCWVTPYSGAVKIESALTNTVDGALMAFDGGEQTGNSCKPFSHHGFSGQRDAVVRAVSEWIFAH
jgi:hypothetical protein